MTSNGKEIGCEWGHRDYPAFERRGNGTGNLRRLACADGNSAV